MAAYSSVYVIYDLYDSTKTFLHGIQISSVEIQVLLEKFERNVCSKMVLNSVYFEVRKNSFIEIPSNISFMENVFI